MKDQDHLYLIDDRQDPDIPTPEAVELLRERSYDENISASHRQVGDPIEDRSEIANNREQILELIERLETRKPVGMWRVNQLKRSAELLYRAYLFIPEEKLEYHAGDHL